MRPERFVCWHNDILQPQIEGHNGHVIKTIGDAFMADFDRAANQDFVSRDVCSLTFGKLEVPYKNVGTYSLKNIAQPVQVYEALWDLSRADEATGLVPIEQPKVPRAKMMAIAGVACVVTAAVLFFVLQPGGNAPGDWGERLAVVAFGDETGDEKLARVQIGEIILDAVGQKFYEFPHVQLVSPLQISKVKKELSIRDEALVDDPELLEKVALQTRGRFMIAGSVSKLGGRFILAAELNDLAKEDLLLAKFRLNAVSEEDILNTMIDSLCGMFQTRIKDVLGIKDVTPYLDLSIGDLTTNSLQAYGHFIKGNPLYKSGDFPSGIAEMTSAIDIDSDFALSYSMIACAYSFIKTPQADSLSWEYFQKARKFKDQFKGISKETLIFRGNDAWYDAYHENPDSAKVYREKCGDSYKLITELYPDDRDGYYYYGLYFRYLEKKEKDAQEQLHKAAELSPEWFPTYRDLAYSVRETNGQDAAVGLLQDYLKQYPNGVG